MAQSRNIEKKSERRRKRAKERRSDGEKRLDSKNNPASYALTESY